MSRGSVSQVAAGAVVAALNHLIKQHGDWAPGLLAGFAREWIQGDLSVGDKTWSALIQIDEQGYLTAPSSALPEQAPRARLGFELSVDQLGTLARDGVSGIMRQVKIEGDAELASAFGRLAKELRWDAEEDLSRLVGDIAAHRIVGLARQVSSEALQAGREARQFFSAKAVEQEGPLVSQSELDALKTQLRHLRDATDRLEARLQHL